MFQRIIKNLKEVVSKWKITKLVTIQKRIFKTKINIIYLLLLVSLPLGVITIKLSGEQKPIPQISTPSPTPFSEKSVTVNRLSDIAIFDTPTPPANHTSVINTMHNGVPLTKYIATDEVIPNSWKSFQVEGIRFKYPSEYFLLPISKQRILVFKEHYDLKKSQECLEKYDLFLQDICPTPLLTIYYASTKKSYLEKEMSYFGGDFQKVAAFYALDNREWLITRIFEDNPNGNLLAQTATSKNIIEINFVAYDPYQFHPKEKAPHKENFANEVFKILSTFQILDDTQITNYKIQNPNTKSSYEIEIFDLSKNSDKQNSISVGSGLDYLPFSDRQVTFIYSTDTDPYPPEFDRFTFKFTFPQGYIREGEYIYDNMRFIIKNKNDTLVPYLESDKYCQVDSDCSYADHYCGVGFYNKYRKFYSVWGCESPRYDESGRYLDEFDKEYQCIIDLKYDGVACTNNKCKGINLHYECNNVATN